MSYLKKIGALFVSSALMASMLAGCGGSSSGSTGDSGSQAEGGDGNYNISIVFKTTSNEYTQYMMAGAEKAAAETGAVLDMKGATSETAYDEQQNMIETDLHAGKYDAMIIAPLQGDMATTLVNGAEMPIFAIDTDFNAPEKISFIGIGQKDAAASGGEKAVEAAKAAGWDKIEAAYIAGVQGDSTADARRTGFQEGIDGRRRHFSRRRGAVFRRSSRQGDRLHGGHHAEPSGGSGYHRLPQRRLRDRGSACSSEQSGLCQDHLHRL